VQVVTGTVWQQLDTQSLGLVQQPPSGVSDPAACAVGTTSEVTTGSMIAAKPNARTAWRRDIPVIPVGADPLLSSFDFCNWSRANQTTF